jgi:hypothetical protein
MTIYPVVDLLVSMPPAQFAPGNTLYDNERLIAVGMDEGEYIGYKPDPSGLCTSWTKVLNLLSTTRIDVRAESDIFLVLANRELLAYKVSSVVPPS